MMFKLCRDLMAIIDVDSSYFLLKIFNAFFAIFHFFYVRLLKIFSKLLSIYFYYFYCFNLSASLALFSSNYFFLSIFSISAGASVNLLFSYIIFSNLILSAFTFFNSNSMADAYFENLSRY